MSAAANPRLIGLFVLGGLLLGTVLLLMFGSGAAFSKVQRYVAYFEGSVNGLNTGAPVKLRGVSIGRVSDVVVQYDVQHNRVLTPVIAEIDLEKVMETYGPNAERHEHPTLQNLIDRGLRARLALQSLVTNQLYVDIDFQPEQPGRLIGENTLKLPEIPTIASSKDEIEKTVQHVAREVRDLPLKETVDAALVAIRRVDHLLAKPETDAAIFNLNQTLIDVQRLLRHLDGKVDSLTGDLGQTTKDARQLLQRLDQSVVTLTDSIQGMTQDGRQLVGRLDDSTQRLTRSVEGITHDGRTLVNRLNGDVPGVLSAATDSLAQAKGTLAAIEDMTQPDSELSTALRDMSEAARAIRRLADTLERHPDNLLYGPKKQE